MEIDSKQGQQSSRAPEAPAVPLRTSNAPLIQDESNTRRVGESSAATDNVTRYKFSVSVVIPVYMAVQYIQATLDSVLQQRFSELEVILVNDGSPDTDELEERLQPYLNRPHFRYLKQANGGPSSARNRGVRAANGEYIAFLDSDDYWAPDYLTEQLRALRADVSLDLIYADAVLLENDLPSQHTFMQASPSTGLVSFESLAAEECTIITSCTVARRAALIKAGFFDESLVRCEDFHLWLRMAHQGTRMAYQQKTLAFHRVCNGLARDLVKMQEARVEVFQKVLAGLALSLEQQKLVRLQMETYAARTKLEKCKTQLLSGEYREAIANLQSANAFLQKRKFKWALLGVRVMPGLLRYLYPLYERLVAPYLRYGPGKQAIRNRTAAEARLLP